MKNQEIQDLADFAANKAIAHIQNHLGQTDGGFAGLYFGGPKWDALLSILVDYIRAEEQAKTYGVSYDFKDGQLVRLFHGRPEASWTIYDAPTDELIACLSQNDANGDFEGLPRSTVLEIFLHDYIVNKG